MLLGDIITAVTHQLPVRLVVFNNGRLGMVKLEQEQAGLPEFGTQLSNVNLAAIASAPGLHAVRVERPDELDDAIGSAFAHPGPVLVDVVTGWRSSLVLTAANVCGIVRSPCLRSSCRASLTP
jgi:pyruvate dehydrogenase (quinone)